MSNSSIALAHAMSPETKTDIERANTSSPTTPSNNNHCAYVSTAHTRTHTRGCPACVLESARRSHEWLFDGLKGLNKAQWHSFSHAHTSRSITPTFKCVNSTSTITWLLCVGKKKRRRIVIEKKKSFLLRDLQHGREQIFFCVAANRSSLRLEPRVLLLYHNQDDKSVFLKWLSQVSGVSKPRIVFARFAALGFCSAQLSERKSSSSLLSGWMGKKFMISQSFYSDTRLTAQLIQEARRVKPGGVLLE